MLRNTNNIISFIPRSSEPEKIFEQYILGAKALPFLENSQIDWNASRWNLVGLVEPDRPGETPRVNFPKLSPEFLEFMKAYVLWKIAESIGSRPKVLKFAAPVRNARYVQQAMVSNGVSHPCNLSPEILDEAISNIQGSDNTIEQNSAKIGWFVAVLLEFGMHNVPYDWRPPKQIIGSSRLSARTKIHVDESHKTLSEDELDALILAFNRASDPEQKLIASTAALLCCAPMRIQEVLDLPRNVDVYLDPGDGYQAGLRWFPKKNGIPSLKFVPKAMVPVAKKAIANIKEASQAAHHLAVDIMHDRAPSNSIDKRKYPHFPFLDVEKRVRIDDALFLRIKSGKLVHIDYHYLAKRLSSSNQASIKTIFQELNISLPDGSSPEIGTHKPRHYLNTIANCSSVPQADIAKWSGRKSLQQNIVYNHETPEALITRLRKTVQTSKPKLPKIYSKDQFDIAIIKEALHSTPSGWCLQSLRQSPCEMFGTCLNCTHHVCIKGAAEKFSNIKAELALTRSLLEKAKEKAQAGMKVDARWLQQYELKITRLTELTSILEDDDVDDGTVVTMAEASTLPQYNPIASGMQKVNVASAISDTDRIDN